jgi:16S rRNA pseudouridine516 synthase
VRLAQILFSQGFGSRRECAGLIASGEVRLADRVLLDAHEDLDPAGLVLAVQGQAWPYHASALLMMNKPAGYECSTKPRHHPGVLSLLPVPLRRRNVQPIGRLDEDTTGLLLLTDSGPLIHRLSSPKRHVPKVYEVTTRHAVDEVQAARLREGVMLNDDPDATLPAGCLLTGPNTLQLTLTEGRYHQVKRMLAAVGNRVDALHRSGYGPLRLPADMPPGQWRWLNTEELELAR